MSKNVGTSNISPLKERFIMDNTNRNQENFDDENVYGLRKITYLEKYGITPWSENELKEKDLFKLLVKTVGTAIDIRIRQRLFIVQNMIVNSTNSDTQISSGSLAEGLDLPGSDIDIMSVCDEIVVIRNIRDTKYVKQYKQPKQQTIFVMERDNDYPGFIQLRLSAAGDAVDATHESIEMTTKGLYLSVNGFLKGTKEQIQHVHLIPHGPCLTYLDQVRDFAFCFRCTYLPYNAASWPMRYRRQ
ncbi:Hypothetical predicted protein [Mytilus galloprovincialis]|uniref:Uncharacterized protein n=1 Tax=Mytilus galloprovincialis TaxID=29158 RepID=A0A8B6G907_MYTGA|nr:Hypothetical predicted protein [Mytilus galloprovincialis]